MKTNIRFTLLAILPLVACNSDYDDQRADLEEFAKRKQIGQSGDYWLSKGSFGVPDNVVLVFGYLDDYAACSELADILNDRYPAANLRLPSGKLTAQTGESPLYVTSQ